MTTADLLRAIRDLDYEPEVVAGPSQVAALAESVDVATLPESFGALFDEAEARGRAVLIEFTGPG